jgi:hypothetical protein
MHELLFPCFLLMLLNENSDLQVADKGKIDLSGLLKLTAGYGENGMLLLNMLLQISDMYQLNILLTLATALNFLPTLLVIILFSVKMLYIDVGFS